MEVARGETPATRRRSKRLESLDPKAPFAGQERASFHVSIDRSALDPHTPCVARWPNWVVFHICEVRGCPNFPGSLRTVISSRWAVSCSSKHRIASHQTLQRPVRVPRCSHGWTADDSVHQGGRVLSGNRRATTAQANRSWRRITGGRPGTSKSSSTTIPSSPPIAEEEARRCLR